MNELHKQIEALLKNNTGRETILNQVLPLVLAKFNSETGTIHKLHEPTQWLRLVAQVGLPPHLLDMAKIIPVGKSIAGQVIAYRGQEAL